MSSYMQSEAVLFLWSVGLGALLLLAYDLLRALRNVIPHHPAVTAWEDLLFWIAAALLMLTGAYHANQGIIRSFLFFGIALGAVLCKNTISPLFTRGAARIFGIPVYFVKYSTNRLLFLVRRCRIYMYKYVNSAERGRKNRFLRLKGSRQIENVKKKEGQKNNE